MFNLLKEFSKKIFSSIKQENLDFEVEINNCEMNFTENEKYGDISTSLGKIIGSKIKKNPAIIGDEIIKNLPQENNDLIKIENIGGFINFTLSNEFWLNSLNKIIEEENYGSADLGFSIEKNRNQTINLEFCSANPTGPLHLGHVRGAIWGNTTANILKFCGYEVTKEYYINDLGGQIEKLIETAFGRYKEALGIEKFELKEGFYPGEYMKQVGENLKTHFGSSLLNIKNDEINEKIKKPVIKDIISLIQSDLEKLGVKFDNWIYESDIANSNLMNEAFDILKSKNLIYEGILEKPKDSDSDWESKPQTIFASSKFGDNSDRALKRSDGQWAYFAKDVAYHLDKIKRDYDWLILEVGIDHNGYKKRMEAAVNALSNQKQKFSFEFHNMVYLLDNGIQQKMSKRSGNSVGVDEIIELIGEDVLKFYMLSKRHDVTLDFDIKLARESSKENSYFYIQYAHARCNSIIKTAKETLKDFSLNNSDFTDIIVTNEEKKLIKKLALWPNCVEASCKNLEPHKINFYLTELANIFHSIWNLGNCDKNLRFLNYENIMIMKYRINLVLATKKVIKTGLELMEVTPLKEM